MKNLSLIFLSFLSTITAVSQTLPWLAESPFSDSYGYTWKTNSAVDGPVFNWIDITQTGRGITGLSDDNAIGPVSIEMDFPFYWVRRDQIWIGSNGYISFSSSSPITSGSNGFPLIPTNDNTNVVLAPFLVDLDASGNNNPTKVYTYFDSLNQQFIVSYHDIPFYSNNSTGFLGANTFQIILNGLDSTITFQYLKQIGNYDSFYNGSLYPFVVGIENITGNMGLMPTGVPIDLSLKPKANTAITFFPPKTPKIMVPDAEIVWVQNQENGGSFFPWRPSAPGPEPTHRAVAQLTNVGLIDIDTPLFIAAHYTDPITDQLLHADTLPVNFLNQGESRYLIFKKPFYPPSAGNYALNIFITNPSDYSDLNVFNDSREAEIVALDTTQETVSLSYNLNLSGAPVFEANASGTGVYFEPHGYPVEVIALEYYITAKEPISGFKVQLFDSAPNSDTIPGTLLFEKDIEASEVAIGEGWMKIDLPNPVKIDSLGFYAAWASDFLNTTNLLTEGTGPFSLRTYDILDDGWVISRNNRTREPMIRAIVNIENAIATVGINDDMDELQEFSIYPNPSAGNLTIRLKQDNPQNIAIRITNIQGQKVYWKKISPMETFTKSLDLDYLPAGVYSIQIINENRIVQKRWVKRD